MSRRPVPENVQARVLVRSRRRCCICFGLNRDTSIKQGQIAHLDQDSSNVAEDNLAFLCMPCHDRYDSTTRQSKNLTMAEVKQFRAELDAALTFAFTSEVRFGEAAAPSTSGIGGHYIRLGGGSSSAELTVHVMPSGDVRIVGEALWGTDREYGPNIGTLDFLASVEDGVVNFEDRTLGAESPYSARLVFENGTLRFEESGFNGYFGMNVTFAGEYGRAT